MTVLAATGEPEVAWAQVFSPVFAEVRSAVAAALWAQNFSLATSLACFAVIATAWTQLDEPVAAEAL